MDNNVNGNGYDNVNGTDYNNVNPQNYYQPQQPQGKDPGHGFAIASLVCGIVGVVMACCCTFLGIVLGVVGIVLAFLAKNKSYTNSFEKLAMAGLILSGVAVGFGIINAILGGILGASMSNYTDYM